MSETKQRKVLVALDGSHFSEYAFNWYLENVHRQDDFVILFTCVEFLRLNNLAPDFGSIGVVESAVAEEKDHADKIYKKLIYMIEEHHLLGKVEQVYGSPRAEITRVAEEERVSLIVTGTRGMGQIGRALLGSVSDFVLHHSHVPVLICKEKDYN